MFFLYVFWPNGCFSFGVRVCFCFSIFRGGFPWCFFCFVLAALSCVLASPLGLGKLQLLVDRPQWHLTPHSLWIGPSWVTRLLLGVDPGTAWSTTGVGGGVGANMTRLRLGSKYCYYNRECRGLLGVFCFRLTH